MSKKELEEINVSGSAKYPWVIATYVEQHKTSGNSCDSGTAATIFYIIYYFSRLNELKVDNNALIDGYYYTRFTTFRLEKWFHKSKARTTLYRALNVLINLNLVVCINDNNEYGNAYRISELGLDLVKNDIPWLDGDVLYKFNSINSKDNDKDNSINETENSIVWK